jgi:SEC-C motif domain protein
MSSLCPCGSGNEIARCCEPYIQGAQKAPTAEALMRSRYTAYVQENIDYLKETLTPAQQADFSAEDTRKWARESEWLGLEVRATEKGGAEDEQGKVEFAAHFNANGQKQTHYETALFEKVDGQWRYAGIEEPQGQTVRRENPKIGRNDPCPCGSGKKYKKCCGV